MREQQGVRQHAGKISAVLDHSPGFVELPLARLIVSSWRRCATQGELDPLRVRDPNVVDARALRELRERFAGLLRLAEPELHNLHAALSGSGYALILTDSRGLILHHVTDDNVAADFRRAGLWPGADWGEAQVGTNGIGTCIAEGRALTVHGDEHFLSQNIHLTCSAAPIRDPHGELLAVLDSSCCSGNESRSAQALTRALVANSARIIENQHFLYTFQNQRVLRFHTGPEQLTLPAEALLAVGEDNRVLATNQATLALLGATQRGELVGKGLDSVFGKETEKMLFHSSSDDCTVRGLRDQRTGRHFYGIVYRAKTPSRVKSGLCIPPAEGDPDACRGDLCELSVLAGDDPVMRKAAHRARRVMDKRIPILLHGETGTGKELFANAIHRASQRREKPFVALNCASIPETLIESELFGYRQGAFTGARREGRRGKIVESSGGTLFLDEIGDMPLNLQSRLLRVLETREVVPLGAEQAIPVNLHVITATHRDLRQQVATGAFREDLYYRLNGITLNLAPLRQRRDLQDIILKVLAAENDTGTELKIAKEAMDALLDYSWPGNMRQLRYTVRTAIALCEGGTLQRDDFSIESIVATDPPHAPLSDAAPAAAAANEDADDADDADDNPLRSAEHQVIASTLAAQNWNISRTAEALDMSRNTLYRKMKKHGIGQARN